MSEQQTVDYPGRELDAVSVEGSKPASKPPIRDWQAGLITGLPVALLAGGPIGLAVGAAYGILAHKNRQDWLDRETASSAALTQENRQFGETWQREMNQAKVSGDVERQEWLQDLHDRRVAGLKQANAGELAGFQKIEQTNADLTGMLAGDMAFNDKKRADQQTFISQQTQTGLDNVRSVHGMLQGATQEAQENINKALNILNEIKGDEVVPETRAVLYDMAGVMVAGGYRTTQSALGTAGDAAGGSANVFIQATGAIMKVADKMMDRSKDWKKSDWYDFLMNVSKANQTRYESTMMDLKQRTQTYTDMGKHYGVLPQDYQGWNYTTGGSDVVPLTPVRKPITLDEAVTTQKANLPFVNKPRASISPVLMNMSPERRQSYLRQRQLQQQMQGNQNANVRPTN